MVIKQPCSLTVGLEWPLLPLSWKEFSTVSTLKPEPQMAGRGPRGLSWGSKASETPALRSLLEKTASQKGSRRLPQVRWPADRAGRQLPTKRSNSLRCWDGSSSGYQGTNGPWGPDDLRLTLTSLSQENEMCASLKRWVLMWRWHEPSLQWEAHTHHRLPQIHSETGDGPCIKPTFRTSQLPTRPYSPHPWTKLLLLYVNQGQILQSYRSRSKFFFFFLSCEPDLGECPSFRQCPLWVNSLSHRLTPFRWASEEAFT